MTPATINAYERLWKLNDHADLQEYGPDLLITDVETVVAALARAERDLSRLRTALDAITRLPVPQVRDLWDDAEPWTDQCLECRKVHDIALSALEGRDDGERR